MPPARRATIRLLTGALLLGQVAALRAEDSQPPELAAALAWPPRAVIVANGVGRAQPDAVSSLDARPQRALFASQPMHILPRDPDAVIDVMPPPPSQFQPLTEPPSGAAAPTEADTGRGTPGAENGTPPAPPPGIFGPFLHGQGGVAFEYYYTGEVFTNMHGGIQTRGSTQYRGEIEWLTNIDLDHYQSFPGGTFSILGENGHGRGISADYVGDFQLVSNIDAPDFTQITEYWWEKKLGDDRLGVRLGKQDCNAEFAVVDLALDFIHSSFGLDPTIPMPSWPNASAAAAAFLQASDNLKIKCGVWDGRPDGRNWGFSGSGVTFSILEAKANWALADGRLPGDLHVGGWYNSDLWPLVTPNDAPQAERLNVVFARFNYRQPQAFKEPSLQAAAAGAEFAGNYGFYGGFDQVLSNETRKKDDKQGLGYFAQYAWAPNDRNYAPIYFGTGIIYRGLLAGRDDDVCGMGMARVVFSTLAKVDSNETTVEWFYKAQLTKDVYVEPDLQYVARPSGIYRDALVFGIRIGAAL